MKGNNQNIAILKKLTVRKLVNIIKNETGFLIAKFLDKPITFGFPYKFSIEPNTGCNLKCLECPTGQNNITRPKGNLNFNNFKLIVDDIESIATYVTLYLQGEPYLNKQFFDMVKYLDNKNIFSSTSTNGHYLSSDFAKQTVESKLDKLIISLDGTTQEVYEKYRVGGEFNKVIEGINNINHWKEKLNSRTPYIELQFIVFSHNEHQISEVKTLGKELKVNEVSIKTAQVYDFENNTNLIPDNSKYSRYRKDANGQYQINNKFKNSCHRLWNTSVITWDGNVLPCCYDKDADHNFGNILTNSFSDIWRDKEANNFRQSLIKSRTSIDICQNCTE